MSEVVNVKPFPPELNKFNWGAFLLSWIWGIFHQKWITLTMLATPILCGILSIIPLVGLLTPFIPLGLGIWFGIEGNKWAWESKDWASVEQFNEYEKKWAFWGVVVAVVATVLSLICFLIAGAALIAIFAGARH